MEWELIIVLFALLLFPFITGVGCATATSTWSASTRRGIAFWCTLLFYFTISLVPHYFSGNLDFGIAYTLIGFFAFFLPLSILASIVCWLVM